ncbi:MAG: hypothetical protein JSR77_13720 [Planctomycetes bacterium]|nr:hypothetical protein [Planctomycetota bacterium]
MTSTDSSSGVSQELFGSPIDRFTKRVKAFSGVIPSVMTVLGFGAETESRAIDAFMKAHGSPDERNPTKTRIDVHKVAVLDDFMRRIEETLIAVTHLPPTMLVSMVSEYDVLLGRLIDAMFRSKPDVLNSSGRTLTFSEISRLGDIEAARAFLIEKEIESVLRDSHALQFDWLENKLKIPLRKGLQRWPQFIELTERRNLYVHTDGVVSSQYIDVCRKHGAPLGDKIQVGTKLNIDHDYLISARDVLIEIGVKLGQVMWRKLVPAEIDRAEDHLIACTYDLLQAGHNRCVASILQFFVEELKTNDANKRMVLTVNYAQALKWSRQSDKMRTLVSNIDVSILAPKFQLAFAVLLDDYVKAASLVREIGSRGAIGMVEYRDWPLFKELRDQPEFLASFEQVFGRPFQPFLEEKLKLAREARDHAGKAMMDQLPKQVEELKASKRSADQEQARHPNKETPPTNPIASLQISPELETRHPQE